MIDALEFLKHAHPEIGIHNPPDFAHRRVILPNMKRWHLADMFSKLGHKAGAEIGVYKGEYTRMLAKSNPEAMIYAIDPWEAYDEYPEVYTQEVMESLYEDTVKRLANRRNVTIMREFSASASTKFRDGELDFVYIDGNHEFTYVTLDIALWSKKVRMGGIVAGHDYTIYKRNPPDCHVKWVVDAWVASHRISPLFIAKGNHGSSWFWVKL